MLNEQTPPMSHCPCCGCTFVLPDKDVNQIELNLLQRQQEESGLSPMLRESHPEIHEDEEHPMRDAHKNPNTGSSPFGMEE